MKVALLAELARIAEAAESGDAYTKAAAEKYGETYPDGRYPHWVGGLRQVIKKAVEDLRDLAAKVEAEDEAETVAS